MLKNKRNSNYFKANDAKYVLKVVLRYASTSTINGV